MELKMPFWGGKYGITNSILNGPITSVNFTNLYKKQAALLHHSPHTAEMSLTVSFRFHSYWEFPPIKMHKAKPATTYPNQTYPPAWAEMLTCIPGMYFNSVKTFIHKHMMSWEWITDYQSCLKMGWDSRILSSFNILDFIILRIYPN